MAGLLERFGIANPWSLLPYLVGIPAVFMAGAMWDEDGRSDRAQRNANGVVYVSLKACMTDKASLYEEIRNGRAVTASWMARFERIIDATDQERAAFRAELAVSAQRMRAARDEANATMKRLDDANSGVDVAWRKSPIPFSIACGVLESPGCPQVPGRPAGASDGGDGSVPGPAAPAAAGPAAVPANADSGSRDGAGGK